MIKSYGNNQPYGNFNTEIVKEEFLVKEEFRCSFIAYNTKNFIQFQW